MRRPAQNPVSPRTSITSRTRTISRSRKFKEIISRAQSSVEVPGGLVEALKDWWFRTGKWCHNNEETAQFEKILTHYTPSADKGLINELSELCDTQERDETEDIVRRYDRFWIATIRSHISHYAPKEQAPKQQDVLSKEYPWLEDGPNWKDLIMLHRETQAAYHAAKGKAADSPECEDFRVKVKRSAREWLRIYNPLIYPQSSKPVEPLGDPMQEKCKNGGRMCMFCLANKCTARRYECALGLPDREAK